MTEKEPGRSEFKQVMSVTDTEYERSEFKQVMSVTGIEHESSEFKQVMSVTYVKQVTVELFAKVIDVISAGLSVSESKSFPSFRLSSELRLSERN